MEKIYSRIKPDRVLHIVVRVDDITPGRINLMNDESFLQCALLNLNQHTTFKPHRHIWKGLWRRFFKKSIAQESWVVIKGAVRVTFYDLDNSVLCYRRLYAGDASFTLEGGHNYYILCNETVVYEYKTGPYEGIKLDKTFIK